MTISRRADLVDTCVLIDLLDIPHEALDHETRRSELEERARLKVELFLPLATVVETGQHVQRIVDGNLRRDRAMRYQEFLRKAVDGTAPWAFSPLTWDALFIQELLRQPTRVESGLVESLATRHLEMGDLTILAELRQMRRNVVHVSFGVWTRDEALRAAASL